MTGRRRLLEDRLGGDDYGATVTITSVRLAHTRIAWVRGNDGRGIGASTSIETIDLAGETSAPTSASVDAYHDRGAVRSLRIAPSGRVAWIQQRDGGLPGYPLTGLQAWDRRTLRRLAGPPASIPDVTLDATGATWRSDGVLARATFAPVTGSATTTSP